MTKILATTELEKALTGSSGLLKDFENDYLAILEEKVDENKRIDEEIRELKIPLKKASLEPRRDAIKGRMERLKRAKCEISELKVELEALLRLSKLGAEPGNIPQGWTCGLLEREGLITPCKVISKRVDRRLVGAHIICRLYVADLPPHVLGIYEKAKRIVDREQIVVASPKPEVFKEFTYTTDPIMFVYLVNLEVWLRLATWDLKRDLE